MPFKLRNLFTNTKVTSDENKGINMGNNKILAVILKPLSFALLLPVKTYTDN